MTGVIELSALRSLGHDGLAELLRLRPELLEPRPPASLRELQGRLNHPLITLAAVRRLDLPTLQVLQVLCALRGRATRKEALPLLGSGPGNAAGTADTSATDRVAALDRAIATLRARGLLATLTDEGDAAPSSVVQSLWPRPLGLSEDVETLA
ncbi:MAG: hypothetical protein QG622_3459, partial [Actinomycetota bacterium]|nr:hypothetical protein [Actinomycetota bacterium]